MQKRWLPRWLGWLLPERRERPAPPAKPAPKEIKTYEPRRILVPRHASGGDTPPLRWSPCHPSTLARFKAEMTCPSGHGLTLRSHRIDAAGAVSPSVVCPVKACSFHEYVMLDEWSFGQLPEVHAIGIDRSQRSTT